jgi:hypothetical protein
MRGGEPLPIDRVHRDRRRYGSSHIVMITIALIKTLRTRQTTRSNEDL